MTPAQLAELLAEILAELSRAPPGESSAEPPVPYGSWEREAVYTSAIALRRSGRPAAQTTPAQITPAQITPAQIADEIAVRLRRRDGISAVRVRPNGILMIVVTRPGEVVREIVRASGSAGSSGMSRSAASRPTSAGAAGSAMSVGMTAPVGSARLPAVAEPGQAAPDFPRTWDNPGFVVRYAHARAAAVQRWARELGVPEADFRPEALDGPYDRAVIRLLAELPSRAVSRAPAWEAYAEHLALAFHDAYERAPAVPKGDEPVRAVHTARLWLAIAVRSVLSGVLATSFPERL